MWKMLMKSDGEWQWGLIFYEVRNKWEIAKIGGSPGLSTTKILLSYRPIPEESFISKDSKIEYRLSYAQSLSK